MRDEHGTTILQGHSGNGNLGVSDTQPRQTQKPLVSDIEGKQGRHRRLKVVLASRE
jgi:hypothetical protein